MTYKIIIRSCTERDITEAVQWYEDKVDGLGKRFLLSLDASIQAISRTPKAYPKVYKDIRRVFLNRFPYGIFYLIQGKMVVIFAVYHEKRNPENLKNRIR
ncbi:MAG: type II toxin-antitoxin system RelE/ParE family toxin [Calditrichaceae bacterium]|nr:type II toxin-antitoxin system RelE/ParE family toxin [Calditrichaceae bacterium]